MKQSSKQLEIFKIWGIPVCLDYSWFIIFFIYSWTIGVIYLPNTAPGTPKPTAWFLGVVTSLLVFFSVLIHELGHSLLARQEGIGIRSITLHIFGGLAYLDQEPKTPLAELRIAAAGPMASFVLALVFFLLGELLLKNTNAAIYQSILHLGTVNFLIACFNLLPGFPMDGGRVLRAILWYFDKSYEKATRLTIIFGMFFAIALVVLGVINLIGDYNLLAGFWTLLAGFMLLRLLHKIPPELLFNSIAESKTVKQEVKFIKEFVNKNLVSVTPKLPISQVLQTRQNIPFKSIPVIEKQQLHGILFFVDAEEVKDKTATYVFQIMKPVSAKYFTTNDLTVEQAKTQMNENDLDYLVVINNDSLAIGYLEKDSI